MRKNAFCVLVLLVGLLLAGCDASLSELEQTDARLQGTWIYQADDGLYAYIYTFSNGVITQKAIAYDTEGNPEDMSLGSAFSMGYEITAPDQLRLTGVAALGDGQEQDVGTVVIAFPDENTLILGDSTYRRVA